MKEILDHSKKISIFFNNKYHNVNIKKDILDILEGAYSAPSYVTANNDEITKAREKGIWIEFEFPNIHKFKEYTFEKLLIQVKPKYNFITFYRYQDNEYSGRCITFNLATNTTYLYKTIMEKIEENL